MSLRCAKLRHCSARAVGTRRNRRMPDRVVCMARIEEEKKSAGTFCIKGFHLRDEEWIETLAPSI